MSLSVTGLLVLCVIACVSCASNRVDINVLDPFTPDLNPLVIIVDPTQLPISLSGFTQDTGIVGGERDLLLTVTTGDDQSIITAGVSDGSWSISTPDSASGFSVMQYDGKDGTTALNTNGLGGLDFTSGGATSLHCFILSDIATTYKFTVYSGSQSATKTLNIPGDDTLREYFIDYSSFSGTKTVFSSVGAFEIRAEALVNVDSFMTIIATNGVPASASASASQSPLVSASANPSASNNPSNSATPSNSASPSPKLGFTWYTVDDDNGREPCEDERPLPPYFMDNENIIYYYFYGTYSGTTNYLVSQSTGSMLMPTISGLLALVVASLL